MDDPSLAEPEGSMVSSRISAWLRPIRDTGMLVTGATTLRYAPQLLPRLLVAVHLRLLRLKTLICSM